MSEITFEECDHDYYKSVRYEKDIWELDKNYLTDFISQDIDSLLIYSVESNFGDGGLNTYSNSEDPVGDEINQSYTEHANNIISK